jgi:protocatechuate 3,4-dioxygenase beta subunit
MSLRAWALVYAVLFVIIGAALFFHLATEPEPAERISRRGTAQAATVTPELTAPTADAASDRAPAPSGPEPVTATPGAAPPTGGLRLYGRVTRRADGSPVAGAEIRTGYTRDSPAVTDANGHYEVRFGEPCRLTWIEVGATASSVGLRVRGSVRLVRGEPIRRDLEVPAGSALRGRVVDQGGDPVPGATVRAWCVRDLEPDRAPDRVVRADALGGFQVELLGPRFVLDAEAEGYACLQGLRGELPAGSLGEGVEVVLAPSAELRGRVIGPSGAAVVGAELELRGDNHSGSDDRTEVPGVERFRPVQRRTRSAADGSFLMERLPPRRFNLKVSTDEFLEWNGFAGGGDEERLVRLDAGVELRGRVLSVSGTPVEGADVRIRVPGVSGRVEATSAADGRFTLRPLQPTSDGLLTVRAAGFAVLGRQPVAAGDGARELELRLDPGSVIRGRVVDGSGAPVEGAPVEIFGDRLMDFSNVSFGRETGVEWWCGIVDTRTDGAGRFAFDDLYEGLFRLRSGPEESPTLRVEVEVPAGSEDVLLTLDPKEMEKVVFTGRVVDRMTGAPVTNFQVTPMRSETGSGNVFSFEDEDGAFRVAGIEQGEVEVNVRAVGYGHWQSGKLEWRNGEHELDVGLSPVRTVHIEIVDALGEVLIESSVARFRNRAGVVVSLQPTPNMTMDSMWMPGGRGEAHGLPAEVLELTVEFKGREHRFELDLRSPPEGPVRFQLPPP